MRSSEIVIAAGPAIAAGPGFDTSPAIDTSIVIATCSRLDLLRGALGSLLQQTWARDHSVELVVVDDRSTDGTAAYLVALHAAAPLPVRVVRGPAQGIAAARNIGFAAARGLWIASFDDDQVADPGWLRALRERADQEDAVCVGGALRLRLPEAIKASRLGPRVRAVLGEHMPYPAAQGYRSPFQPATNNALLRRDLFRAPEASGDDVQGRLQPDVRAGFDTRFTEGGEDKELFRRLGAAGHRIWFEPAARADHVTPQSRLQAKNLRWTSRRLGASDARFALLRGPWRALAPIALRVLAVAARDLPRLLLGSDSDRLDTLCSLWYTEGLVRAHLALCWPGGPGQKFIHSLNFRHRNGERTDLRGPR